MSGRIVGWTDPNSAHKCDPPGSDIFGTPSEDVEDFTIGTVWRCDCGKTHIVTYVIGHPIDTDDPFTRSTIGWTQEGWFARKRRERRAMRLTNVNGIDVLTTDRHVSQEQAKAAKTLFLIGEQGPELNLPPGMRINRRPTC